MSIITRRELGELDLDWYCIINNRPAHIASMGGPVPESFTERVTLREVEENVARLPFISDVSLNEEFVKKVVSKGYEYVNKFKLNKFIEETFKEIPSFNYNENWNLPVRMYANSFVDKARKGFYSYARMNETNTYVLVASPSSVLNWRDAGLNLKILIQGQGEMPETIDMNLK